MILFESLKKYGFKSSEIESELIESGEMTDAMVALLSLKDVLFQNDRLKDEIHQVIHSALKSYYDLSKF